MNAKRSRPQGEERYCTKRRSIFSRIAKLLTHRLAFVGGFIILQLLVMAAMVGYFSNYFVQFFFFCLLISAVAVLAIVSRGMHPDYKIAWIVPILTFPVFGGLFYLLFGGSQISQRRRHRMERLGQLKREALDWELQPPEPRIPQDAQAERLAHYLYRASGCPPHANTDVVYFPSGETMWQSMLEEIKKAEHFVFLQYFIVQEGVMWDALLDLLEQKAKAGVEVRLLYDDIGCLFTLPKDYPSKMRQRGIACAVVNPFRPVVSLRLNNRDHRKICVVDGHTGYTGGINLADEYINVKERFGHWKDTGILLRGSAVWNLTVMFLANWDYSTETQESYERFRPECWLKEPVQAPGIVQPFEDSPLDREAVSSNVYLNLMNRATSSVYITTPYLVLDYAMVQALCTAAKAGVDVRIITPHIPDKKSVFEVTRANYPALLEAGVKIYEYEPGFIHAKTFVVDGRYAVVGTINLDYRSLYLHFECGVWIYDHPVIAKIEEDFQATMAQSIPICLEQTTRLGWVKRLYRAVLRLVAPLM